MHEQLVPFVPAVPFVGVPQVVDQVVDVVLLVLGIHAGLESLYLPEQGVHGHLAFGLFLLEVLDTVHLDFHKLLLLEHPEVRIPHEDGKAARHGRQEKITPKKAKNSRMMLLF